MYENDGRDVVSVWAEATKPCHSTQAPKRCRSECVSTTNEWRSEVCITNLSEVCMTNLPPLGLKALMHATDADSL